ncbi:MAG: ATP-binding protein, partial [Coriobacteriia bacterium]|nr:ATP-binding protein [Coriobacteriia bacterium]
MDPRNNPFAPGAGAPPPALVGRDNIIESADIALHRIRDGRPEKSQMLLGLRGVGKTVLLNRIGQIARELGYLVVKLEAPEGQRLAAYLAPALKGALMQLSRSEKAKDLAGQALGALRGFASAFKVSIGELEFGIGDFPVADTGNLEIDLAALLVSVGTAARAGDASIAILVDEIQYLTEEDLRALIVAFHMISQEGLPIVMFAAGLPQVAGLAGDAKSYAERLFDYPPVGPLSSAAAG